MPSLRVPVTSSDHIQGDARAAVSLIEYGDYECPHCGLAQPHVKLVQQHYGNQLRFVFRHFPLTEVHPHAQSAAESAEYAGVHGRFWEMHDLLFENQSRLSMDLLFQAVQLLGLSDVGLREALVNGTYTPRVRDDFLGGMRSGVNGTPSFFINGLRYDGPFDYPRLVAAIDLHL
jgi:protein-disulfide isomerase